MVDEGEDAVKVWRYSVCSESSGMEEVFTVVVGWTISGKKKKGSDLHTDWSPEELHVARMATMCFMRKGKQSVVMKKHKSGH